MKNAERLKELQNLIDMYNRIIDTYASRLSDFYAELQEVCDHAGSVRREIEFPTRLDPNGVLVEEGYNIIQSHCCTCGATEIIKDVEDQ